MRQVKMLCMLFCFINIGFAGYFPWSVHTQHSHTAVNDFHSIKSRNIGNGSASAYIYLSKLCSLECDLMIVKNLPYSCNIFCICIIRTGFSSGSCKFVQNNSSSQKCRIFLSNASAYAGSKPALTSEDSMLQFLRTLRSVRSE